MHQPSQNQQPVDASGEIAMLVILLTLFFIFVISMIYLVLRDCKKRNKKILNVSNYSKLNIEYLNRTYNISNIINKTQKEINEIISNNTLEFAVDDLNKISKFLKIPFDDLLNKDLSKENN